MSKYVKDLITDDIRGRLTGVQDALLVSLAGLDANKNYQIRKTLRASNIQLMVVKNSMARRAVEGTPLATAFEQAEGSLAVVWGSTDIVALAKSVTKLTENKDYEFFVTRGGVMDGARLSPEQVKEVSKWPSREEQLSILLGQIMSPGSTLVGQLGAVGGALASQIKQKGEGEEAADGAPAPEAAPSS